MALANFIEMRDKVGSPAFLYRKKVEQTVHHAYLDRVFPQYNLVSFSTVPYTEAQRRGRELDVVIDRLVAEIPAARLQELGNDLWHAAVVKRAGEILGGRGAAVERPVIDITPSITEKMGVWPGDTPITREVLCDMKQGANITLSTLRTTVHLGAHADGPNHYGKNEPGIGERTLTPYVGACQVVHARTLRGVRVKPADLGVAIESIVHPRVLIRTGTFPDFQNWNNDFAGLSVELVDALAARGVITIGVDAPSVDLFSSKDLEAHNAILRHDISILEGLDLSKVEPGEYELIALPLKLIGFDGSPVRAVLRGLESVGSTPSR
jgi:arylformamidase